MTVGFDELNIYEISNFKQEILNTLEENESKDKFELDFEFVESIDLCSIQLLLSLKKYCDEKKLKLQLININAKSIRQKLKLFNLNETLGVVK